jgi:hypothetical protein
VFARDFVTFGAGGSGLIVSDVTRSTPVEIDWLILRAHEMTGGMHPHNPEKGARARGRGGGVVALVLSYRRGGAGEGRFAAWSGRRRCVCGRRASRGRIVRSLVRVSWRRRAWFGGGRRDDRSMTDDEQITRSRRSHATTTRVIRAS